MISPVLGRGSEASCPMTLQGNQCGSMPGPLDLNHFTAQNQIHKTREVAMQRSTRALTCFCSSVSPYKLSSIGK